MTKSERIGVKNKIGDDIVSQDVSETGSETDQPRPHYTVNGPYRVSNTDESEFVHPTSTSTLDLRTISNTGTPLDTGEFLFRERRRV